MTNVECCVLHACSGCTLPISSWMGGLFVCILLPYFILPMQGGYIMSTLSLYCDFRVESCVPMAGFLLGDSAVLPPCTKVTISKRLSYIMADCFLWTALYTNVPSVQVHPELDVNGSFFRLMI